jgi:hypothetical protein
MCFSVRHMMPAEIVGLSHSISFIDERCVEVMVSAVVSYHCQDIHYAYVCVM